MSESEFDLIAEHLAGACEACGMPFQIGASHMSAHIMLERVKRSVRFAPGAIQIVLPDWLPLANVEIIDFLKRVEESANGIGLVLYNPPHAKRVLSPQQIGQIALQVPGLVGLKTAGSDDAWYASMRKHLAGISVFIPGHLLASGIQRGAQGSYSNMTCLNPQATQAWADQTQTDLPAALALETRVLQFMREHIVPWITDKGYSGAACDRLMAMIGNWADVGSMMRWPYRAINEAEADRIRPYVTELIPEFAP